MFRPIRTIVMVLAAFVAGIFYERNLQRDACAVFGGSYAQGLCREATE
ncbi:MAG: hypothetical protein AAF636_15665 [Pseudomonadota bacterium]